MDIHNSPSAPAGRPLVYACAGCSDVGRLAYDVARAIDRSGVAQMSCLAGVGARHPSFLRQLEGRQAWVIDGCPIECGRGVFEQAGLTVHRHLRLHELGFRKQGPDTAAAEPSELAGRFTAPPR